MYHSLGIIPGIAVGIVKDGKVIFKNTYGYSNIHQKETLTPDTQFYIASSTKSSSALIATNYFSLGDEEQLFKVHQRQKRSDNTLDAAGGLFSNLNDIIKWVQLQVAYQMPEIQNGTTEEAIIKTRRKIATVNPSIFGFDKDVYSYGLGWSIGNLKDKKIYFHGGTHRGHRTMISYIPELNAGIVRMTNDSFIGNSINYWLSSYIYDAILNTNSNSDWKEKYYGWINSFGDELEKFGLKTVRNNIANRAKRTYNLTVEKRALTGIYFNEDGDPIRIFLQDDQLNIRQGDLIGGVEPYVNENTIRSDLARVGVVELDIQNGKVIGFSYLGHYYTKY